MKCPTRAGGIVVVSFLAPGVFTVSVDRLDRVNTPIKRCVDKNPGPSDLHVRDAE